MRHAARQIADGLQLLHLPEAVFRFDARRDRNGHALFERLHKLVELFFGGIAAAFCQHLAGGLEHNGDHTRRLSVIFGDRTVMQVHPHIFGLSGAMQREAQIRIRQRAACETRIDHVAIEIRDFRPAFFHRFAEQKRMTSAREQRVRVVVDHRARTAPQHDDRNGRSQQQLHGGAQACRPLLHGTGRGIRPVEARNALGHFTGPTVASVSVFEPGRFGFHRVAVRAE